MKWKVENALNRDVERQHLNKILKEIEARVSSSESSQGLTEQQVRDIVRSSLPPAPRPPSFLLSLDGDVAGTALLAGQDVTMDVELQVPVVEEAPMTGFSYWRTFGEWTQVPNSLLSLAINEDPGFLVNNPSEGITVSRLFEAVMGELVVVNPDGIDGNVLYGLADVVPTAGGTIKTVEFDSKGRRIAEGEADTDDLPEGTANLYFTEERTQDAIGSILEDTTHISLAYDDNVPSITATLTNTNLASIADVVPSDGDILEWQGSDSEWEVTKAPRVLHLDGGNF